MPLLQVAKTVTVLRCGPDETGGGRLIEYFGRHGVDAQLRHNRSEDDVGEIIIDTAREVGGAMVVMGAYGRSKLREAQFGGPTRYVLTHVSLDRQRVLTGRRGAGRLEPEGRRVIK